LSLIVTRDWGGAGRGEGATVVADSNDAEDAGIIEPAMDDMTDALLEGWNEVEDSRRAVREEPRLLIALKAQ
jgi:hypothetical protein